MASRHGFVDAKIARVLDDGRGEGAESDYKPWLTVRDVPSQGRSHWLLAAVTLRAHQLLSDLERGAFLIYDFRNDVRDIREQFPLDLSKTRDIAQAAGIAHPVDSNSRTNLVQTTDLVVGLEREARIVTIARSEKPADALGKPRAVENLEIERRYWAAQHVDWGIITERELPQNLLRNLELL